ncbi:hypothetical protein GP486_002707 [Trichoglossum hirsutum]|uniref:HNH nuclease domain-containing protein n=1 Tax=Trichoglossum hirsutum TaxID=265104 RepID=A0A9P8RRG6_9PEZI|nr:hypothetical protein GP486_002707 [Trichoglossum hirsutum]
MGKVKQKATDTPSSPPQSYLSTNFEIPERTSSLAPLYTQQKIQLLRQNHNDLKRKASELSQDSEHLGPAEYLQIRQEQVRNHEQQYQVLFQGLQESFTNNELKKGDFEKLAYDCWRKRARLTHEDVTISRQRARILRELEGGHYDEEPDFAAAYAELLTNIWRTHENPAGWEVRDKHEHDQWKGGLRHYYNAYDPKNQSRLWCPILKEYALSNTRTAAHIVPHSIGYAKAGYLFGERDRGAELIWSMGNGLVMSTVLGKQFDKGDFVLVPITAEDSKPSRWQFVLMNEKLRTYDIDAKTRYEKYGDLDGTELEFKNDNRPAHRFLYYHFVSTLLRYVRYEKPGWAEKRVSLPTGKVWATPGPYLRKSMLKTLANVIGDVEPSEELFGDGAFDGTDSKSPQEEKLMAQEILVERAQRAEGEILDLPVDI